jgi:CcmD family protein
LDVQFKNSFRSIGSGITTIAGVATVEFFADHQLYIVMGIVLIIWFGFIFYLFRLDKKISRLEKSLRK